MTHLGHTTRTELYMGLYLLCTIVVTCCDVECCQPLSMTNMYCDIVTAPSYPSSTACVLIVPSVCINLWHLWRIYRACVQWHKRGQAQECVCVCVYIKKNECENERVCP